MDDVRDAVVAQGGLKDALVGHVAGDKADLSELPVAQEQSQAVRILLEIVNPRPVAAPQQVADDPAPNTAITARQQHAHEV